eukprot:TRINITY_DN12003_c0_g1_i1.p1 TRINITY_DN12003_c0_g1~~TRINITY_DN12003_c0_g1_i1.p1  ORF type:complete len:251 (+),score=38.41 TRINITY_DN12003_c0_g1_i1:139-891(+)
MASMSLSALTLVVSSYFVALSLVAPALPEGFAYVSVVDNEIAEDLRYFGSNNFMGSPVNGYESPRCILTVPAAKNLSLANKELAHLGLRLKVYDCYRPQRAVDNFISWSHNSDMSTQAVYYPHYSTKEDLFANGYIAKKSGHSRGSTVDLTIVPLVPDMTNITNGSIPLAPCFSANRVQDESLDMGTNFDCMDVIAHTDSSQITELQKQNRQLLVQVMKAHNFINYENEWWHFTLADEPFPDTYFDFVVR